jgi:leader peptidase (prepilin peptidase)/N-methyltransferase
VDQITPAVGAVFAFAIGAIIGSFVNVVAYRVPRELSIVSPGSRCPACLRPIPPWANIPIISYVALRGRCIMCKERISLRYPAVEAALGLCAFYLYLTFPLSEAVGRFVLCAALMGLSLVDYDWRIIPNLITLPGIPIGTLAAIFLMPSVGALSSVIGILAGGGLLFVVGEIYYRLRGVEGVGMGDVKLIAMIGAFLGWQGALFALFVGSLAGSIVGLTKGLRAAPSAHSRKPSGDPVPDERGGEADRAPILRTAITFGPFLSIAAVVYALLQPELGRWYLPD